MLSLCSFVNFGVLLVTFACRDLPKKFTICLVLRAYSCLPGCILAPRGISTDIPFPSSCFSCMSLLNTFLTYAHTLRFTGHVRIMIQDNGLEPESPSSLLLQRKVSAHWWPCLSCLSNIFVSTPVQIVADTAELTSIGVHKVQNSMFIALPNTRMSCPTYGIIFRHYQSRDEKLADNHYIFSDPSAERDPQPRFPGRNPMQ